MASWSIVTHDLSKARNGCTPQGRLCPGLCRKLQLETVRSHLLSWTPGPAELPSNCALKAGLGWDWSSIWFSGWLRTKPAGKRLLGTR